MTKRNFIDLAKIIKGANGTAEEFTRPQLEVIALFCRSQNPAFNQDRWLSYIRGECGPNGGTSHISEQ